MLRKDAILLAAADHFGRFGFRGASLRDIARDAGVSLTLLNHHFGAKASLLSMAIETQGRRLDERAAAIAAVQRLSPGAWGVQELVQAWLRADSATASTHDGRLFLQLLARIEDDTSNEFDPVVHERVRRARPAFIEALLRCRPGAGRRAAEWACLWVGDAVHRHVLGAQGLSGESGSDVAAALADDEVRLVRFLTAGVEAALATQPVAPSDGPPATREPAVAA